MHRDGATKSKGMEKSSTTGWRTDSRESAGFCDFDLGLRRLIVPARAARRRMEFRSFGSANGANLHRVRPAVRRGREADIVYEYQDRRGHGSHRRRAMQHQAVSFDGRRDRIKRQNECIDVADLRYVQNLFLFFVFAVCLPWFTMGSKMAIFAHGPFEKILTPPP